MIKVMITGFSVVTLSRLVLASILWMCQSELDTQWLRFVVIVGTLWYIFLTIKKIFTFIGVLRRWNE